MTRLFGLFADLRDRPVLVVGGGAVAVRKVRALLEAGARVTVGAPVVALAISQWAAAGQVRHVSGHFTPDWLDDCWLVVAATSNHALNRQVAAAAAERRIFANVVDDAELSSVQMPAVVDRGPLQIAISTAGAAPAIGRRIRADLEARLAPSLGALLGFLARARDHIKRRLPDPEQRRHFYEALPEGALADRLACADETGAWQALDTELDAELNARQPARRGRVTLVGAGPGDPGLLTLHGLRALQDADVILHDRLGTAEVLALARRDARRIPVGKAPGAHAYTQDQINALMVAEAAAGQHVVRLKGGDPFIFGRGGEELQHLRRHHIPYRVVPGITAATACGAYAGVPLTHRDHAQSVTFVTAHRRDSIAALDWRGLVAGQQTLAIYMGVARLGDVQSQLLAHGRAADTPFALIEHGASPRQRVVSGTLAELTALAARHEVAAPALLIVGEVAALADELAWFGAPPLSADTGADMGADMAADAAAEIRVASRVAAY